MLNLPGTRAIHSTPPFTVLIPTQAAADKLAQTQKCAEFWQKGLEDLGCSPNIIPVVGKDCIAAAYNSAISNVTSEFVILSHQDAFPASGLGRTVGGKIYNHMKTHDLDIAGFCGSSKFIGPRWQDATLSLYGHCLNIPPQPQPGQAFSAVVWQQPARVVTGIRVADGYCIIARTSALRDLPFDPQFTSWHYYDTDRFLEFYRQGKRTAVLCDVSILHQSAVGYADPAWAMESNKFLDKWKSMADCVAIGCGRNASSITSGDPNLILAELEHLEGLMQPACEAI